MFQFSYNRRDSGKEKQVVQTKNIFKGENIIILKLKLIQVGFTFYVWRTHCKCVLKKDEDVKDMLFFVSVSHLRIKN